MKREGKREFTRPQGLEVRSHGACVRTRAVSCAMGIAAEAAGLRERGPSVTERRQQEAAAEEEAEASRNASRRRSIREAVGVVAANLGEAFDAAAAGIRGRVRMHFLSKTPAGLELEDERRKCLAEKGWARRSLVVHSVGASGAANLDALPGREDFGQGEGEAWLAAAVGFVDDNFDDEGGEVRSMDQRDRKVGLFGDFCERVGHGKFVQWVADAERGGYYSLKPVTQACARCSPPLRGNDALSTCACVCADDRVRGRGGASAARGAHLGCGDGVRRQDGSWPPVDAQGRYAGVPQRPVVQDNSWSEAG